MQTMGRKDDVILVISQDNENQSIEVSEVKGEINVVEELFGFTPNDLIKKDFNALLPERIRENIQDYVEYEQFGNDIADVLKRTPNFCVKHQNGETIDVELRVQQGLMGDHPRYILIMTDKSKSGGACIAALEANAVELSLDEATGFFTRDGFISQGEIVMRFLNQGEIKASLALIEWRGESNAVVAALKRNFRKSDQLAHLGNGIYGALLLKTDNVGAEIALQRLQKSSHNEAKMAFHELSSHDDIDDIVAKCENQISVISAGQEPVEIV
jgi:hypothetical protein